MIEIENTSVFGWEPAIRGMRNPMNSWDKSDSIFLELDGGWYNIHGDFVDLPADAKIEFEDDVFIGPNDHELMMKLRDAGTDHRKFMRMIVVYADITAPLYWWKEFDTYKVGTVANSCSTMHKIQEKEFVLDDFSHEHLIDEPIYVRDGFDSKEERVIPSCLLNDIITILNACRNKFIETKDKKYWWQMIQLLPTSYNQRRTVMLNYEVLANIYEARKNHKLDEWRSFRKWIDYLPYSELITGKVIPIDKEERR